MQVTNTARIDLRDDGLVVVKIHQGAFQSLEDAHANLAAAIAATAARRRPLLVDIRGAQPLDAAVRHYYSGRRVAEHFSALALLVESTPLGRMMGNVYFRVVRLDIPTQLFSDESAASKWLTRYTM
ncbi:MAG TPA: hypothetical protein VFD21_09045 [Vicinamibacterales bacterium]|jgi:S-adenosylmethionine:diacylglycerol 3-amino-3-carboxypropyl transferase|nr:hypothetical protein [Vicinamibacterales bacterium]